MIPLIIVVALYFIAIMVYFIKEVSKKDWIIYRKFKIIGIENMEKSFFTCKNCGEKFYEEDSIKVERGYKVIRCCPKCNSSLVSHTLVFSLNELDSEW